MPDYSLPPCVTLVFGRPGSGKTSLAFRYLANIVFPQPANLNPAACIFIFDWKLEASRRLGIAPVGAAAHCEAAIATRWVVFNPHIMFGEKLQDAFRWFCHWTFEVSKRGAGKKVLFVDELWQFVDAQNFPDELERVIRIGRAENMELLTATQFPRDYHRTLRASVTEWVCFSTDEPGDLDAVRPYFRGVDRVAGLPRGSFIAYNRDSGAELAGKIF
jgi:hypothetical protein